MQNDKIIYLDNQSTTPIDPLVLDEMIPYLSSKFGNSSSQTHRLGWEANKAIEESRIEVANLINCEPDEIIFTSGATESNNLALKGCAYHKSNKSNHIITLKTEHKAVLDVCKSLSKNGFNITYLDIPKSGIVNLESIQNSITKETFLISIMHANNETGVIQPIKEIGEVCKNNNILFHVDAAQSAGKITINIDDLNIDLLSISAHKMYGPKGVGALFIKKSLQQKITSQINGGGQEYSIRGGTLPTHLIAGLGKACKISNAILHKEYLKISKLSNSLKDIFKSNFKNFQMNGDLENRLPGNLNICFSGLDTKKLIMSVPNIAFSLGSACTSSSTRPSHVLLGMGLNKIEAASSIRLSIGRFNTIDEVLIAGKILSSAIKKNRPKY